MKKDSVTISFHSLIDIITNSSTEVFVFVNDNTKKALESLINKILKASGSKKEFDDLFVIEIEEGKARINDMETGDEKLISRQEAYDNGEEIYMDSSDKCIIRAKNKKDKFSLDIIDEIEKIFSLEECQR